MQRSSRIECIVIAALLTLAASHAPQTNAQQHVRVVSMRGGRSLATTRDATTQPPPRRRLGRKLAQVMEDLWQPHDRATTDEERVWAVGMDAQHEADVQRTLCQHEAHVLHPLPGDHHHWLVVARLSSIRSLLLAHPHCTAAPLPHDYKVSPGLEAMLVAYEKGVDTKPETLMGLAPNASTAQLSAMVAATRAALSSLACPASVSATRHHIRVTVCHAAMTAATAWLAAQPRVSWVSLGHRMAPQNLHAAAAIQAPRLLQTVQAPDLTDGTATPYLPFWKAGLTGKGQVVGVTDAGIDLDSCFFYDPLFVDWQNQTSPTPVNPFLPLNAGLTQQGQLVEYASSLQGVPVFQNKKHRKVVQYVLFADITDMEVHGTHVSGTIAGTPYGHDSLRNPTPATGVAPGARLAVFNVGASFVLPNDPGVMYDIQRTVGARITSNSWSDVQAYNYDAPDCYAWDAYSWLAQETLHVFAAGNEGSLLGLVRGSGTVTAPASCKNTLGVGATENWVAANEIKNLVDGNNTLLNISTTFGAPKLQEDRKIRILMDDGTPDITLVDLHLYSPLSIYSFLFLDSEPDDIEVDTAMDATRSKDGQSSRDRSPGEEGGSYDADVDPLKSKKTIKVVQADPPNACHALRDRYDPSHDEAVVVLVKKTFSDDDGSCTGDDSAHHVFQSGASGAILYWADTSQLVQSGSKHFRGKEFPAFTIGSLLGEKIWHALDRNTDVRLDLVDIQDDDAPIENVAGFSAFGSGLVYTTPVDTDFSSVDVRIKPDLVAPGNLLSATTDGQITGEMDQCDVKYLTGTSMATPVVAGAAAIVRQYFSRGYYPEGIPSNKTKHYPSAHLMKAVLIAGATAMKGISLIDARQLLPPPSIFQGFGRVDLSASLPLPGGAKNWRLQVVDGEEFVADGLQFTYTLEVKAPAPGEPAHPLIFTLVWNDFPAFPGSRYVLVNNLDLVVTGPASNSSAGTQTWWGNGRTGGDYQNNVEKIIISAPTPGTYDVSVRAAYLFSMARPQPFSLVALGGFEGQLKSQRNPSWRIVPRE